MKRLTDENAELRLNVALFHEQFKVLLCAVEELALSAAFLERFERVYESNWIAFLEKTAKASNSMFGVHLMTALRERTKISYPWTRK